MGRSAQVSSVVALSSQSRAPRPSALGWQSPGTAGLHHAAKDGIFRIAGAAHAYNDAFSRL
jgi:hypothetical protein